MLARLFYLVSTLLFFTGSLRAQVYEPGFLVRSTGDTLRGELENSFWVEPPTFIRYRPTSASNSELFQARQLRAISFTNGRYFRHESLVLDRAAETRLQELPRGYRVKLRTDSVLAEVLLTGQAELLRVVLPGAAHYEVRRPGQPPLRLSERKYLVENKTGGTWSIVDGNNYRSQLELYFADCPAASQAATKAAFTATGLTAVVQAYATACSPTRQPASSWAAQGPRRRGAFQVAVLGGVRYNRLESPSYIITNCTDCGLHPFGGFYAELLQPSRTTAFYAELTMSAFRNRSSYSFYDASGTSQSALFDYRALLGTARVGIRFLPPLPHDKQLLIGLGFEYNKVFGLNLPNDARSYYYPNVQSTAATDVYATPILLPNLTLGLRRQRLTLLLDGQVYVSRNFNFADLFFAGNCAVRLGMSYRLGRNPDNATTKPKR